MHSAHAHVNYTHARIYICTSASTCTRSHAVYRYAHMLVIWLHRHIATGEICMFMKLVRLRNKCNGVITRLAYTLYTIHCITYAV